MLNWSDKNHPAHFLRPKDSTAEPFPRPTDSADALAGLVQLVSMLEGSFSHDLYLKAIDNLSLGDGQFESLREWFRPGIKDGPSAKSQTSARILEPLKPFRDFKALA